MSVDSEDVGYVPPAEPVSAEQMAEETDAKEELLAEFSSKGDENFYRLVKAARRRVRRNWDYVMGWTGEEGVGKSTGAAQFGKAADERWAFARNMIFSPKRDSMKAAILGLPKYAVVDADEAMKALYKLKWQDALQQSINLIYGLCRRENKISELLIPRFSDFNEYFRNHRIRSWIHVVTRGVGVLMMKHWSPFVRDPWMMKENELITMKWTRKQGIGLSVEQQIRILQKLPIYVGLIEFEPWTREEEAEIDVLRKAAGVYDEAGDDGMSQYELMWRDRVCLLMRHLVKNKILSFPRMAEIVRSDVSALRTASSDFFKRTSRDKVLAAAIAASGVNIDKNLGEQVEIEE